jgi:hypothetical protein
MPVNYIGIQTIADFCGVERTAVYQWLMRHGPESRSETPVPDPTIVIAQKQVKGETKKTYGWDKDSLPKWRRWYANLKDWDETTAAHRWVDVDASLREKGMEEWLTSL